MAHVPVTREGRLTRTRNEQPLQHRTQGFGGLFDRMFRNWLAPFEPDFGMMRLWDFDMTEKDNEIMVRAEVPGFDENELDVQLRDDVLTIRAEKEQRGEQGEEYRDFYRSITLPSGIDADKVQATYRNGVLELHIPRTEAARPRQIKVQGEHGNGTQGKQTASASHARAQGAGETTSAEGAAAGEQGSSTGSNKKK